MKDKLFLAWIHQRLKLIHGEPENADYMWKLRSIINGTPAAQESPCRISLTADDVAIIAGDKKHGGASTNLLGDQQEQS